MTASKEMRASTRHCEELKSATNLNEQGSLQSFQDAAWGALMSAC